MPFNRPSLQTLINRTRNDLFGRLSEDDPLRRSDAEAYARVLAGAAHELYGYLDWLAKQIMPDTAESEHLERWASIWGVGRKAAASASGTVVMTGSNGAIIATGTAFAALDGVRYLAAEDTAIASGTATVPIAAETAGANGNRLSGETFSLVSPVAGVNSSGTASAMSGGVDIETDDALRARLLTRIRKPPQGGALYDYEAWALEVPGVTRAWPVALQLGPGTVVVRFVRDDDGTGGIIPDVDEIAAVQAYIDSPYRRPVTAQVTVAAPIAQPVDIEVSGPASASGRAVVEAALAAVFRYDSMPGASLLAEWLEEAVEEGGAGFAIESPLVDVSATSAGHLHTLGSITWL